MFCRLVDATFQKMETVNLMKCYKSTQIFSKLCEQRFFRNLKVLRDVNENAQVVRILQFSQFRHVYLLNIHFKHQM